MCGAHSPFTVLSDLLDTLAATKGSTLGSELSSLHCESEVWTSECERLLGLCPMKAATFIFLSPVFAKAS